MTAPQAQAARLEVPGLPDLQVYDYATVARAIQDIAPAPYRRYESVFPGWDNTARRGDKAVVMHDADPAAYESWLAAAVDRALRQPSGQGLVFLNAWNEWAEGCHLEPDRRYGRAFLEATRLALSHVDDRSAVPAMAGAG
jgi:lipopolysaccharide biosynthesis protein